MHPSPTLAGEVRGDFEAGSAGLEIPAPLLPLLRREGTVKGYEMSIRIRYIALFLLAVLLAGCDGATESPTAAPATSVPATSVPATPVSPLPILVTPDMPSALPSPTASPLTAPPVPPGETLAPAWQRARAELATRLEVDPSTIELVSVSPMEMPIQFLGCPPEGVTPRADMPGMVMGEEVVLRHSGIEYVYHAHLVKIFYCGER